MPTSQSHADRQTDRQTHNPYRISLNVTTVAWNFFFPSLNLAAVRNGIVTLLGLTLRT